MPGKGYPVPIERRRLQEKGTGRLKTNPVSHRPKIPPTVYEQPQPLVYQLMLTWATEEERDEFSEWLDHYWDEERTVCICYPAEK